MSLSYGKRSDLFSDSVYNIYYIVAHLFEVGYEVHVVNACLVLVVSGVDVFNVCCAQLVAEVVDFTLLVVAHNDFLFARVLYVVEQGV